MIKETHLKRNNARNPQIKSYTDAIKRGQKTYHILPSPKGWKVKKIGSSEVGIFQTKIGAEKHAKRMASQNNSSEIIIHDHDGHITERILAHSH